MAALEALVDASAAFVVAVDALEAEAGALLALAVALAAAAF